MFYKIHILPLINRINNFTNRRYFKGSVVPISVTLAMQNITVSTKKEHNHKTIYNRTIFAIKLSVQNNMIYDSYNRQLFTRRPSINLQVIVRKFLEY